MALPLPSQYRVTTAYGIKGSNWQACGYHTGADYAAPIGTPVYAVVDGDVRYRSYGPAFGLQLAVSPDTPGEWFYAHLSWRVPDGTRVKAGDLVGKVGNTGNSTGPHLHLEWHPTVKNAWRCGIFADPVPEIARLESGLPALPAPEQFKPGVSHPSFTWMGKRFLAWLSPSEIAHDGDGYQPGPKFSVYDQRNIVACQKKMGDTPDPVASAYFGPRQWRRLGDAPPKAQRR